MDILNEDMDAGSLPPDMPMSDLVDIKPESAVPVPQGAIRNRAATSALLQGDPNKVADSYQMMMLEGSDGKDTTHQQITDLVAAQTKNNSVQGVIRVLGDRSIPLEQKKRLMNFVQQGNFKEEPAITLQSAALAAPSKGEDIRGEAARVSTADALAEMQKEREDRQKLVNGAMAQLPEASLQTVADMTVANVLPFGRNVIAARVANTQNKKDNVPANLGQWIKNFLLPGSTKADLQNRLNSIPPENRQKYTESLLASIKESAAVFHNDNYFAQYQTAVSLLDSPRASTTEVWAENVGTVLDAFWVSSLAKSAGRMAGEAAAGPRAAGTSSETVHPANWELVDDAVKPPGFQTTIPSGTKRLKSNVQDSTKRIELNSPVHRENPVAPYSLIEQVNPAQAKEIHRAMVAEGDELAQAMTGVSKEQALTNNAYPQVATDSGAVLNKANQDLEPFVGNTGALRYTPQEFQGAVDTTINDFRGASGMEINDAMTTFKVDGDHLAIDAHYTTAGGAWTTPEGAKQQAMFSLRSYGITADEITVMERNGMDYVPATGNAPGDYIIKVKTRHAIQDSEVPQWNPLDVKRNWTDRISQTGSETHGNLSGMLMDPGSMLHPTLTSSAAVATDQAITFETTLLRPIKELRTQMASYPIKRRGAIEEYMKEANQNGLPHDPLVLTARGFSQTEIDSLKLWRDIWDGHYYLENFDMVRTLNSQGYQVIDNGAHKFFARPVPKNQNIGKVYDPGKGQVVTLNKTDMDSLYNTGGTYASLRRSVMINGDEIEHILVRNTPTEYLRKVRATDPILNYREGYYTVNYKAPKFIDEITINSAGKEVRRTVGVAGNTADADMFAKGREASTGNRHLVREDSKGFRKDGDGYWDLQEASGRIAQRMRGQPLVQATGINNLGVGTYIENPMESAVRAAKSLAGRTIGRPMLETAKKRFVAQYGEFLPPVAHGPKQFPMNRTEIVDHVSHTSSKVADARTTYNYIKFLENGYINSADEIFKGGMNVLADMLGKYHLSTGERAVRYAGDIAPSHLTKATVFQAYIAFSNPVRQWIVQSHQVTRTMAYNPIGWFNGKILEQTTGYLGIKSGLVQGNKLAKDFTKFVDESGMVAGVDKNSLVRGMGLDMADSTYGLKRGAVELASLPQRVGFDLGEKMNQIGHLSAVYEKYVREGKNIADKTIRDQAMAEARALSYDLNKAGELAYTQGSAAAVLQFLQMPHKAMLQLTNRKLPLDVSLRLAGWDLVMFGLPVATISAVMTAAGADGDDILPNDPEHREMFVEGLESYALNKFFSDMDDSGDRTHIDFSALKPNDMDGWAKMIGAFSDKGMLQMIAASPAGQILAVDGTNKSTRNGRIPQAVLTMGRFFNVVEEIDPQNPTDFQAVLNDVAKITSGWTAASNAKIMMETRKKFDTMGVAVDSYVTSPEIAAAFLGFGTMATKDLYDISQRRITDKKKHEEDVMSRYRDIVRYYSDALQGDNVDVQHVQKVSSMLMRTFSDPGDRDLVYKQWQKDMMGKEQQLFQTMMDASDMPNANRLLDDIKLWPVDQATKDQMTQRVKDIRALRDQNKETK
jgi:hypothetical protein